ncbi:hypothetical protein GCM10009839_14420 [Catenulispora yoronensis]|uniref:DUF222 domain-containing protein n=1 Tax=Catenulispora yoronensis TaxID=450799 RepID=A0ABP5F873_9ACTN
MNRDDLTALAARLAADVGLPDSTGTVMTGGPGLAAAIETLIDDAALSGAFADLADRPSIETTTLTHADRTVWICAEFDRNSRLLRAGPVPVTELINPDLTGVERIADTLVRLRRLMASAVLLGTRPTPGRAPLTAVARPRRGRLPLLALTGPALTEVAMETARTIAQTATSDPDGPIWRLGRALAQWNHHAPSPAQTAGPEALTREAQDAEDGLEEAENDIADLIGPARIPLDVFAAAALTRAVIAAIATQDDAGHQDAELPSMVAVACGKRRTQCEQMLTSVRHAQQFIHTRTVAMPEELAEPTRRRIAGINAAAVQAATIALLLTDLAETADAHGEHHAAAATDNSAAGFENSLARTETNAWTFAVDVLRATTDTDEHRFTAVTTWEKDTGQPFGMNWRYVTTPKQAREQE